MTDKRKTYTQALNRVASYCSKAERCCWDVMQRLQKYELSSTEKEEIVDWLVKENFLSEERYAKAFVNEKVRFSRWGRLKIRQGLIQKKIPNHLINEALSAIDEQVYTENLLVLANKKRKELEGEESYMLQNKLIKYLGSRGFLYPEIEKLLSEKGLISDNIW